MHSMKRPPKQPKLGKRRKQGQQPPQTPPVTTVMDGHAAYMDMLAQADVLSIPGLTKPLNVKADPIGPVFIGGEMHFDTVDNLARKMREHDEIRGILDIETSVGPTPASVAAGFSFFDTLRRMTEGRPTTGAIHTFPSTSSSAAKKSNILLNHQMRGLTAGEHYVFSAPRQYARSVYAHHCAPRTEMFLPQDFIVLDSFSQLEVAAIENAASQVYPYRVPSWSELSTYPALDPWGYARDARPLLERFHDLVARNARVDRLYPGARPVWDFTDKLRVSRKYMLYATIHPIHSVSMRVL